MSKEDIEKLLNKLKSNFQCLEGWKLDYVDEGGFDRVVIMPYLKGAVIYPPSNLDEVDMEEYLMHEVLHVVLSDSFLSEKNRGRWEDILITDICQLIWPEKFNV